MESAASVANHPLQYIIVNGIDPTPESFDEVASVFGKNTDRKTAIGVGFILSYFQMSPETAAERLKKYLSLSVQFDLPVMVQLDGEQWWGNRPDLWNWWDDRKPGYNPENRKNVEWTAWTPDSAVKIGWRNWGSQLRVLPMPNLMSPAYRDACHIEMGKLIPIVIEWWNSLPKEKKYLLVGIKMGWESAIGVNNWYYPNGNDLLNQPEKNDPSYGLNTDSLPGRGVTAIGYASVSKLGLANSGQLKEEQLTKVVQLHLEDLCKFAADHGVPRDRLFTHCGGWSQGETLYTAAINKYSCPGWSFYTYAVDPKTDITAMKALESNDAPYWGAVEWLFQGDHTKEQWASALKNTMSDNRIRYMCIYNWRGIKNNVNCISAIKEIIQK
ncbi:MAG: hypothetical protein ABFD09_11275 [Proteiniphilum sp.]